MALPAPVGDWRVRDGAGSLRGGTVETLRRWEVEIEFEDGTYHRAVYAAQRHTAYIMALGDARMGSKSGAFYGKVLSWSVT